MKPRVRLLSLSQPDWNIFVQFTTEITGRSPTRKCDEQQVPVGDAKSYLVSLSDFGSTEIQRVLTHFTVSFLIHANFDWMFKIIEFVPKMVGHSDELDEGALMIFTGTLLEWKTAIIKLSQDKKMRFLANQCYVLLEQNNLDFIFKGHSKESQADGTFVIK